MEDVRGGRKWVGDGDGDGDGDGGRRVESGIGVQKRVNIRDDKCGERFTQVRVRRFVGPKVLPLELWSK